MTKSNRLPSIRLGVPIVERTYSVGRSRRPSVTLQIGKPRPVPGWDWACPVRIQEGTGKRAPVHPIFGVDALQSLLLALEYCRIRLTIPDRDLRYLGLPVGAEFSFGSSRHPPPSIATETVRDS
ncbi:MAG: hypothetical protein HOP28_01350 [Gemmatimonadales bacterium]|nr:hypothetical protein [Gemmatimonadales bacterium]